MDKNTDKNFNQKDKANQKDTDISTPGKQKDLGQQKTGGLNDQGVKQDKNYDKKNDRTHV